MTTIHRLYRRGASVMLLKVVPAVLLGACVLIWLDPDDRTPFRSILINNGVALYVLLAIPALGISLAHTRALAKSDVQSVAAILKRSVEIGVALWLVVATLYLLALFGTLNRQMWLIPLLAVITGASYGVIMGIFLRRLKAGVELRTEKAGS